MDTKYLKCSNTFLAGCICLGYFTVYYTFLAVLKRRKKHLLMHENDKKEQKNTQKDHNEDVRCAQRLNMNGKSIDITFINTWIYFREHFIRKLPVQID